MKKRNIDEMSFYVEQAKKNARSKAKNRRSLVKIMMDTGMVACMNTLEMIDVAEVLYEYAKDFRTDEDLKELRDKIDLWKSYNLKEA